MEGLGSQPASKGLQEGAFNKTSQVPTSLISHFVQGRLTVVHIRVMIFFTTIIIAFTNYYYYYCYH